MSGHRGERTQYPVVLRTDDFRVYHQLAQYFQDQGIHLLGVPPEEPLPVAARVILGGPPGDDRSIPLRDDREANLIAVRAALDDRPTAHSGRHGGYRRIVFGIDPGRTTGIAMLADDGVLMSADVHDAEAALDRIATWRDAVTADTTVVHIGDGDPQNGEPLYAAVRRSHPEWPVDWIEERSTSPATPATSSRHTDAAIHIALRRPGPPEAPGPAVA